MNALSSGSFEWLLPLSVLLAGLGLGPLPIVVRGYIRGLVGPKYVYQWYRPATVGLAVGLVGSVVIVVMMNDSLALNAALLCLLLLLASIDWQWRWLPIEWTIAVIGLGAIYALRSGDHMQVLIQMATPAVALLVTRQIVLWAKDKETLGLGDIWLVAGLGAFLAPFESFLLIGFAALSGLLETSIRMAIGQRSSLQMSVAYGTHLCIIFVVIRNFTTLG